jgi:2-hydroxychromene-2-carboxylate isomerase
VAYKTFLLRKNITSFIFTIDIIEHVLYYIKCQIIKHVLIICTEADRKKADMKITYWSDYACPYCYIGEARMKKALEEIAENENVDVEIEMKAFQLDPSAGEHATGDTQTRFAKKYGISYEHAGRSIEHISEMGRGEGIDFKYATTLFTNTMDAHRLTKLAQSKDDPEIAIALVVERGEWGSSTAIIAQRLLSAYFDVAPTRAEQMLDLVPITGDDLDALIPAVVPDEPAEV